MYLPAGLCLSFENESPWPDREVARLDDARKPLNAEAAHADAP